jgi:hypothetical protein
MFSSSYVSCVLLLKDVYSYFSLIILGAFPNRMKRLLPSACPSVSARLSTRTSAAATGRISVKFDTGDSYEDLLRKSKFS